MRSSISKRIPMSELLILIHYVILQPLVGLAIDQAHIGQGNTPLGLGDYQTGIAILMGFSLMGLIAALFVRETYCRYVNLE